MTSIKASKKLIAAASPLADINGTVIGVRPFNPFECANE